MALMATYGCLGVGLWEPSSPRCVRIIIAKLFIVSFRSGSSPKGNSPTHVYVSLRRHHDYIVKKYVVVTAQQVMVAKRIIAWGGGRDESARLDLLLGALAGLTHDGPC